MPIKYTPRIATIELFQISLQPNIFTSFPIKVKLTGVKILHKLRFLVILENSATRSFCKKEDYWSSKWSKTTLINLKILKQVYCCPLSKSKLLSEETTAQNSNPLMDEISKTSKRMIALSFKSSGRLQLFLILTEENFMLDLLMTEAS